MTTILNLLGYLTLAGLTEISLIKMLLMLNCILTKKFITLYRVTMMLFFFFFFQAEDGIRDYKVTGFRRVLFRSRRLVLGCTQRYHGAHPQHGVDQQTPEVGAALAHLSSQHRETALVVSEAEHAHRHQQRADQKQPPVEGDQHRQAADEKQYVAEY